MILDFGCWSPEERYALRAIAESPKAAYLLGINVEGLFYLTSFTAAARILTASACGSCSAYWRANR